MQGRDESLKWRHHRPAQVAPEFCLRTTESGRMADTNLTHLPVELWRQIIQLATAPHDEIDTSPKSPFKAQQYDDLLPQKRQQMIDKISFSMVSKGWRDVATEYLFESLVVDVEKIPRRIHQYNPFVAQDRLSSPFRYVRCLEVYSSWQYASWAAHQPIEAYFAPLERMFHYSPDLVVFKHRLNYTPPSLFTTLLAECGRSIRSIDIASNYSLPRDILGLIAEKTACLEYLAIGTRDDIFPPSTITLPCLHTLILRNFQRAAFVPTISWSLPRLEYLSWSHAYKDLTKSSTALHSFPRHVRMLDIQQCPIRRVQEILERFPTLEILFLRLDFAVWVNLEGHYPHLRKIGILLDIEHHGQRKRFMQATFDALTNRENFPSVSHIHLYGVTPSADKRNAGWWQRWMLALQSLDIRLVDFRGDQVLLSPDENAA